MTTGKKELRYFEGSEVRALGDEKEMKVSGHAAMFEKLSEVMGFMSKFQEKIAKGAFVESLNGDVRAFSNHNTDLILARTTNGSLKLAEDDQGLAFDMTLPDTQIGRDTYQNIRSGLVTGVSFGFRVESETWEKGKDGKPNIRTLNKIKLFEISPTPFPAYPQTDVAARSIDEVFKEQEERWAKEKVDVVASVPLHLYELELNSLLLDSQK